MKTEMVDGILLKKFVAHYSALAYFQVDVWAEDLEHAWEQIHNDIVEPQAENMTDFDHIAAMEVELA